MADGHQKRQIYIVGGKGKNVPRWLSAAFNHEQFDQENAKTRTLKPAKKPDAVVVLSSWVGHEHFYGARDLAERLEIPMILSPGGWTSSLKAAADLGVEWFIQDIERTRNSGNLTKSQIEEVEEFIDNAWREAYNREWSAREALERRYSKDRGRFDHAQQELVHLKKKEAAAQRVIAEIREAAAQQREASTKIEERSARVSEALAQHINSLRSLFDAAEAGHAATLKASTRLGEAKRVAQGRLDALQAAMTIAEDGLAMIRQVETTPVSASNAGTDS